MAVATQGPGTKTTRQRRALESYVAKLEHELRGHIRGGASSIVVSIDGFSLTLDPWTSAHTNPLAAASEEESARIELVRESIALWLKILVDLRNLGDGLISGMGNLYELQAELMLDSAFGSSLLRELQDCVDGLVKRGGVEEARQFSKLHRHLRGIVRDMKKSITESNAIPLDEPQGETIEQPIEQAAEQPIEQPVERKQEIAPATAQLLNELEPTEPVQRPRRRPRPQATAGATGAAAPDRFRGLSRTACLVVLNAVALVVYLVQTAPFLTPGKTIRALALGDFPNVTPLIEVQARPPALYAIVDGKTWSGFDDKEKHHFVDGMGNVLLTEGYGGLILKTADGRLVSDWLEHGGTHVFDVKSLAPAKPVDASAPEQPSAAATVNRTTSKFSRFVP
jgi:hypothetical protein